MVNMGYHVPKVAWMDVQGTERRTKEVPRNAQSDCGLDAVLAQCEGSGSKDCRERLIDSNVKALLLVI